MRATGRRDGEKLSGRRHRLTSLRPSCLLVFLFISLCLVPRLASAAPIHLWHAYRDAEQRALEDLLARWPGEPVDALALPFEAYASKLAAAIPLGEGPDLYIDTHSRLGNYRARKLVAPAGDALEEGVFAAPALAAVTSGGVTWAVPLSQKCVALYVNEDLVRGDLPRDLESFVDLVGTMPRGTVTLAYNTRKAYHLAPLLGAFGGALLDEHDGYGFVGPAAEKATVLLRDLIEHQVVPEDADDALVTNLFKSGQAAFAVSGPWLAASLAENPSLHYRVVQLPFVRGASRVMQPYLTVEAVMLSPNGARRPEVRALARFLASRDAALVRAKLGPTPSARVDVTSLTGDIRAFAEQALVASPQPSSRAMDAVWDPADRAMAKILHRDAEPEVALEEGRHRFDDVRRPLPGPASPLPALIVIGLLGLWGAFRWSALAREPGFGRELRRSLPAYRYVAHAIIAVGLLVIVPLVIGAATSLFAGSDEARRYVGLANFLSILTARGGPLLTSGSFYLVLLVTILWTVCNLALHVGLGVALALLLSRSSLRLRALYRVLLIIPWAVPSYVTALAWKGMFHRQFGAVTGVILWLNQALGLHLEPIAWFSRFSMAFTANLATNAWLGFPFMMVVTLGALTGVPGDVLEAAKVDGATRWQRLRLVTLPIIGPTLMPAVTLGAIWTFNMFNVVYLVSGGDPDGTTDILVSEAYRWAFTRENQYGYAAAYAVLIFLMLFGVTRLQGRSRKAEVAA